MPPGEHYLRAATFQCHWHEGCGKRFSSKRRLFVHLEQDHGMQQRGGKWRAGGFGSRLRRQNQRSNTARSRSRSPEARQESASRTNSTLYDKLHYQRHSPLPWWADPSVPSSPHFASQVSFAARGSSSAERPPPADGAHSRRAASAVRPPWALRAAASRPAGASPSTPLPSSRPAARPPSGRFGGSTSAETPPAVGRSNTAERPPCASSSADRPPSPSCVEGAHALSGRASNAQPLSGFRPDRPRGALDATPVRPRTVIDDDLWVPSPSAARWWDSMQDSDSLAASLRL